jgi:hypothetical protein
MFYGKNHKWSSYLNEISISSTTKKEAFCDSSILKRNILKKIIKTTL